MKVTLMKAGYCTELERIAKKTGEFKQIEFPASFLLIEHPKKGLILFDTGYSKRVLNEMKKFPFQIYAKITPVFINEGESAKEQLEAKGIAPEDIQYIILSHFHVDHMGGLLDFPNATFICSKHEYNEVKDKKGFSALKSAFIPSLLPKDFKERSLYVEDKAIVETPIFSDIYPESFDLFGDGSILAISLPGHTSHQFGIFIYVEGNPVFFIADACWLSDTFKNEVYPSSIIRLILKHHKAYYENIHKIHQIYKKYPQVKIIACHDKDITL